MKKVAILLENIFDEQEVIAPFHRLREDYEVHLVGTEKDKVYKSKVGFEMKSTHASKDVKAEDYVGLVIPGGFSPDFMRRSPDTIRLVKEMHDQGKPIAAICHGPWMLATAIDIKGKNLTSFYSIKSDIENAGANWVDAEVVVSDNLITSRNPMDLPEFLKTFIQKLG